MKFSTTPLAVVGAPDGLKLQIMPGILVMQVFVGAKPHVVEMSVDEAREFGVAVISAAAIAEASAHGLAAEQQAAKRNGLIT